MVPVAIHFDPDGTEYGKIIDEFADQVRKLRNPHDKLVVSVSLVCGGGTEFLIMRKLDPEAISVYRA